MKATVHEHDFHEYQRVIVTSDIHGDDIGFQHFLKQVQFNDKQDALIIVGDILQRGEQSMKLLKRIMRMKSVYLVMGNNDVVFEECFDGFRSNENILEYMKYVDFSVLNEIAHDHQLPYQTVEDIETLKQFILNHYQEELEFLKNIPDIIDTPFATFVHAGLEAKPLENQNRRYCLTTKAFGNQTHKFEKLVVVGHWPTSNYSEDIISINPYFNQTTNVISIDGGNSMKRWAQINYLIFDEQRHWTMGYYDGHPKVIALDNQKANTHPMTLIFPNTKVKVLDEYDDTSICYVPYLNKEITLKTNKLYHYKGEIYSSDFTTYQLEVNAGDLLEVCDGNLMKKDGIIGYYYGKYKSIFSEK